MTGFWLVWVFVGCKYLFLVEFMQMLTSMSLFMFGKDVIFC